MKAQQIETEKKFTEKEKLFKKVYRKFNIEISLKEEIAKRSTALAEKCKQDLKMALAICRVPRLAK